MKRVSSTSGLNAPARKAASLLIASQAALAVLCAVVATLVFDTVAGGSALLGGAICVIPNGIFAFLALRHAGARAARRIANAFYMGEAIKLLLTALLFAIVLAWLPVNASAVLLSFIVCMQGQWLAPVFFRAR